MGGQASGTATSAPAPGVPEPVPEDEKFFDPRMGRGPARGDRRRRAGFEFVQEGRFQHDAEVFRWAAVGVGPLQVGDLVVGSWHWMCLHVQGGRRGGGALPPRCVMMSRCDSWQLVGG